MSEFSVHITPEDCPLVTTYSDWLAAQEKEEPEEYGDEADYVGKILALDYCHWMLRRTSGGVVDDAHASDVRTIRRQLVLEFEARFKMAYFDPNEEKTF